MFKCYAFPTTSGVAIPLTLWAWVVMLWDVTSCPWVRAWQPTWVFLPGESHGQRDLVGYSP